VLFVHPHVQFLKVANPGTDVRDLINGCGLVSHSSARKERQEGKKQGRSEEESVEWCFQLR
jgi:hypothetical protein